VSKSPLSFSKNTVAAVALIAGIVGGGCAHKKPDPMDSVSGVIVKPAYMKLSPSAVAHVRLADVTKGYVESETVVEKTVRPSEDGSIPFTLEFKEKEINPSRKYAVDVRVVDRDNVVVIGGKGHSVITKGNPHTVEMDLSDGRKF
jgi:uncharacterized lipoprotein YbaY